MSVKTPRSRLKSRLSASIIALLLIFKGPALAAAANILIPPFENLTGEPRLDWIGEGFGRTLTEKLNLVAELSAATIKARGFYTMGREIDLTKLPGGGAELDTDLLVFGAVIKGGDVDHPDEPLVVTVRIIETGTTRQREAIEFTGKVKELFSLESDLAASIAGLLGVTLSPAEAESMRTGATRSLETYKETILGSMYLDDGKYDEAITMFERAMAHHPGIFYPRGHTLLARAYSLSGRKQEMLDSFKKDAVGLAAVYYNLGMAQEFSGDLTKAGENYQLFLKYTDKRTLLWRTKLPGAEPVAVDAGTVRLRAHDGSAVSLSLVTGKIVPGPAGPPAVSAEEVKLSRKLIPDEEQRRLIFGPVVSGGQFYYALDNQYLIGRSLKTGERTWAYRLASGLRGPIVVSGDGVLCAGDAQGNISCLGLNEGSDPNDLTAHLKLASLALKQGKSADAEEIYRFVVEEVKFNVPEAWRGLFDLAKAGGDEEAAAIRWRSYQESQY